MARLTPANVAEPTAQETISGGSYIPQKQLDVAASLPPPRLAVNPRDSQAVQAESLQRGPINEMVVPPSAQLPAGVPQPASVPQPAKRNDAVSLFQKSIAEAAQGRASEVNDFMLTLSGITDGDPVGMETFDLGFFEDGTPSISINGANVPIRHEQWMSLLTARNRARTELDERMRFDRERVKATTAVNSVIKAIPNLPVGMSELFMAQAEMDPASAMNNLSSLYVNMQKNGGVDLVGKLGAQVQAGRIAPEIDRLTREGGEEQRTVTDPLTGIPSMVKMKAQSISDRRAKELMASPKLSDKITGFAFGQIKSVFIDPMVRQERVNTRYGIFDRIAIDEQDRTSPLSLFSRLQHLAANGQGVWPVQIPIVAPSDPRYPEYLQELDAWASSLLGYDASSPESLLQMFQQQQLNLQQAPSATAPAASAPAAVGPTATTPPRRSGRTPI